MPRKNINKPENQSPPEPANTPPAESASDAFQPKRQEPGFPIVGIGASAGGLAAFEAFFSAMPTDTESGMAFVLVQHLAPDHKSILADLIKRYTRMKVYEVIDGMPVKPNCTYIIPPNRDMALHNGTLQLLEPTAPRGLRLPIDFFFRSLAQDQRERAICIVFSGTGSDGTLGVRTVKGEGGMVMAQSPETTEHDGMPRSVIDTGMVDYILPPAEMPAQLISYVAHAFGKKTMPAAAEPTKAPDLVKKVCILLRAQTGHDFSQYKETTLLRRIDRRMALQQVERPDEYLRYLQKSPAEIEALFRDLLIGVTNFFRDPEAFAAMQATVIPRLFAHKPVGGTVRVWVCGCSTGEEAYSLAILIQEHLETLRQPFKVQIFATDVDRQAIEQARSGIFPASIVADVSAERLARYFTQDTAGGVYRIRKTIRDLLVFSEQDVIKDPPFSKLNLVSCRNLLIYLNPELQKTLLTLFHYALIPGGMLFLGTSESLGELTTHFDALDRKWKIFLRHDDISGTARAAVGEFIPELVAARMALQPLHSEGRDERRENLRRLIEQALLAHYAQAALLVNGRGEIHYIYGRTGQYLEPAPGDAAGMNVLAMAREGLQRGLTNALHRAVARKEVVHYSGLPIKTNGDFVTVNLTVSPVKGDSDEIPVSDMYLVIFEAPPSTGLPQPEPEADSPSAEAADEITSLKQELRAKEEYLQATIEEMETTNEELKSTNEEMQSVNEELQSANEELETSKEELQSVNEELSTVNAELQDKVAELSRANNDMNNLLSGTGVGTLFIDMQLRITRFTPTVTKIINLIQSDVGRPVAHIVSNLEDYDRLVEDVKTVLDSLVPHEAEVRTRAGTWYLMHIRPYRTLDNVIEGVVITFVDITARKEVETALREAILREAQTRLARNIVETVREPLLVLDNNLRVVLANRAFYNTFQVTEEETLGRLLYALGNRQWDISPLRQLLKDILLQNSLFNDFEVTHGFERIGRRTMRLNARRVLNEPEESELILLAIEDITGRE